MLPPRDSASYIRLAALALALPLMLVACAAEDEQAQDSVQGSVPTSSEESDAAPGSEDNATPESEDDGDGSDAVSEPEPAVADSPGACLHGTWLADNQFFLASLQEFGDEAQSVTGEVLMTFTETGELTTEYRGWLITAVAEGVTVTVERSGTDVGQFSANETTIDIQETEVGSTVVVSGSGMNMAVPADPVTYAGAGYTCSSDAASISTPDGALQLSRR